MTEMIVTVHDPVAVLTENARAMLSIADPGAALHRPLADVVRTALDATSRSRHTRRAYEGAIASFVDYLDAERGDLVPEACGWRPFVQKSVDGDLVAVVTDTGRTGVEFVYSGAPAAVLRLVDAGLLDSFAAHRCAQGDTDSTVAARVAAVRSFLSVALRDNILTQDQAQNMDLKSYRARQRRDRQIVGRRLSKVEVQTLRAAVDTEAIKGKRDLAILDMGLYLGLRESEIAALRMVDFCQDGGRWWLVVKGKRGKTRRLKVHDQVYKSLTIWLEAAGLAWHDERPVFYSVNKGGLISERQIRPTDVGRLVAAYGAKAGLSPARGEGRLGAHDLRRTCARNAYDNGASLLQVQRMLGHADPKTTAAYIGLGEDDTNTAVDFVRY